MMGYNNYWNGASFGMGGVFGAGLGFLLVPLMLWSLVWKGWALWKAAKNNSIPWFVALLVINTLGILEILYIFVFGKGKQANVLTGKKKRK
jgi:hypothetical protein